jgi:hypothetical protein
MNSIKDEPVAFLKSKPNARTRRPANFAEPAESLRIQRIFDLFGVSGHEPIVLNRSDKWRAESAKRVPVDSFRAPPRIVDPSQERSVMTSTRRYPPVFSIVPTLAIIIAVAGAAATPRARAIGRTPVDPAQVVPLDQIEAQRRDEVADVIKTATFHYQAPAESFPANPKLYLSLLNEPSLTLALWNDLGATPARLQRIAPGMYQGTDGSGTTATWHFVYRSPTQHVLLCWIEYQSPRGKIHLNGRLVLNVRSAFYRHKSGQLLVQHSVEAFVKIDSKGWRSIAKMGRPIIENVIQDQVKEAGQFISLMCRLVEMYPVWATRVAVDQTDLADDLKNKFRDLVLKHRRPGSSSGRPKLLNETAAS